MAVKFGKPGLALVGGAALICALASPVTAEERADAENAQSADTQLPPEWLHSGWEVPEARFGIDHEVASVEMDDGVVLQADILYPKDRKTGKRAKGAFPVLLEQTPYRWSGFADLDAVFDRGRYFVNRGYIYVLAHQRGTADSGGVYDMLGPREARDGVVLADWAAGLAEADGQVGLIGCSADGLNQFLTAKHLKPDSPVKAIAANGIGANLYNEPVFPGGMYSAEGDWFFEGVVPGLGTKSAIQKGLALLQELRAGGENSLKTDYWNTIAAGSAVEQVVKNDIPVLLYSSWDDVYPSSPYLLTMLQNAAAGQPVNGPFAAGGQAPSSRYQIIMAPGLHCSGDKGGPRDQANLRWFETWLRGAPTGIAQVNKPYHFHSLNSPEWKSFAYAPQTSAYTRLFLAPGGKLSRARDEADSGSVSVAYGDRRGKGLANATFTTEPFEEPTFIAGPSALNIVVQTDSQDVLVIGDLYDVAPDGTETRITRGNLVGSLRTPDPDRQWRLADGTLVRPGHAFDRKVDVPADTPMSFEVPLQPRLTLIDEGHRLRLVIKGRSDGVTGDCHLELGPYPCLIGTIPQQRAIIGSTYEVELGGQLVLPLLPRSGADRSPAAVGERARNTGASRVDQ